MGNNVNCIDEKIPFELPEGWAFIRLNTAWELISGRDLSPSEYNDKMMEFHILQVQAILKMVILA
ncbi:hypothetical protein DW975_03100 [Agathobacter rectalis]|uniref:Type I restriction modification DNA specificity domain-containing protein n=1 Tax=Agathobacter rectalis TaxID=39491 RepID=A0A413PK55_9FIRM|nr:hypothetical protein DW975_03100 [Agathobacter rectalis]